MSWSNTNGQIYNYLAGVNDIPKGRLVNFEPTNENSVDLAVDGSKYIVGVSKCKASQGHSLDVVRSGVALVELGSAVQAGDAITAGALGVGVVGASGDFVVGFAETAGVASELISVFINPHML